MPTLRLVDGASTWLDRMRERAERLVAERSSWPCGGEDAARCVAGCAVSSPECPARLAAVAARARRAEREVRLTLARAPKIHWPWLLGDVPERPSAALAAVRRWLPGRRAALVLAGRRGRGKSGAACSALAEVGGHYVRSDELAAFAAWSPEWRLLARAGLLVCDASQLADDRERATLGRLVEVRYDAGPAARLILCVSLDRPAFAALPLPDALDRLRQREFTAWEDCGGPNLRHGGER